MKYLFPAFFAVIFSTSLLAQDTAKNFYFKDEWSLGIYVYNNGWGFDARKGKFLNPKSKRLWEFGYNNVKHPKEFKQESFWLTGRYYVYGKLNSVYNFYFGGGKQRVLYQKREAGTVEIKLIGTIGANLALLKPIYYEVYDIHDSTYVYEKYKPSHQPATILAQAPFSYGLNEITAVPGVYAKLSANFDYAKDITNLNAIEIGIKSSFYLKKLEIMAEVKNYNFFVALFLSYRFGYVYEGNRRQVIFD